MERYRAQINIPEIGTAGQKLLSKAKVLVIGAGGLGCPVLIYLAGSGIGVIGVADDDKIDLSNINRQILYSERDVNINKTEIVSARLKEINSEINIIVFNERLTKGNAIGIIEQFDLVIDCSDNFETRRILDDVCYDFNKPWIYAAVSGFQGQVSVFNYKSGCRYKDLFPSKNELAGISCSDYGILGSTCAHAASIEVNEAIKIILNLEGVLDGRVLTFDLMSYTSRVFKIVLTVIVLIFVINVISVSNNLMGYL